MPIYKFPEGKRRFIAPRKTGPYRRAVIGHTPARGDRPASLEGTILWLGYDSCASKAIPLLKMIRSSRQFKVESPAAGLEGCLSAQHALGGHSRKMRKPQPYPFASCPLS